MSDNHHGINLINLGEMKKIKWNDLAFLTLCMLTIIACSSYAHEDDDDNFVYVTPYTNNNAEYVAVFGDIQYYTDKQSISIFKHTLNWLEKAKEDINIISVLHTGDITNNNDVSLQWQYFKQAMNGFSLPFISNIGNHDYTWNRASEITDRFDTHFNEYVKFPLVVNRIEAVYEEGRMENMVIRNEIHGQRYDFLLLEFGPRVEVVKWAKEWVASHPDIKFIMMTHEYLEKGGGRRVSGVYSVAQFRNTTCTTPEELWNQLVKCNDNIVCVLCGHVGGLYAVTFDKNDYGREVCQIQHNIQGSTYRYDNWLMMWEFPNDDEDAKVSIVNTKTGQLYNSEESLFSFKYIY